MKKKSFCADDSLKENDWNNHTKNIIETYSLMVYRLAYSLVKNQMEADDIHQEVFIKYLRYKPSFENENHEKAWFIKVTTNECKNWWKTAWRRKMVSMSEYEVEDRRVGDTHNNTREDNDIIEIVKNLPQKYRVVIHLFYYEELSVEEIANILGLKQSTVRTHLTRARRKLSEMMKEEI